jgi:DNA replication protein DnaC
LAQVQALAADGVSQREIARRLRSGGNTVRRLVGASEPPRYSRALCEAEVFAREASGARQRIRHAGFPAPKTLEDFDFTAQPGAGKPLITHLAQLAWVDEAANVCFLGPPGRGSQCTFLLRE